MPLFACLGYRAHKTKILDSCQQRIALIILVCFMLQRLVALLSHISLNIAFVYHIFAFNLFSAFIEHMLPMEIFAPKAVL